VLANDVDIHKCLIAIAADRASNTVSGIDITSSASWDHYHLDDRLVVNVFEASRARSRAREADHRLHPMRFWAFSSCAFDLHIEVESL
jgi:hypothetical protein